VAINEFTAQFDTGGVAPPPLRVAPDELAGALAQLDPVLRAGLEIAIANVAEVAFASVGTEREVRLRQGHTVRLREVAVDRAAVYVPGGLAPYISSVVMGVVTARAAGVGQVAVCTPPPVAPALLAACALTGVEEVYQIGGAQAIAALAYGSESVPAVDVIVGPGNLYVQEAKRIVSDRVGIDSFAGPSDLLVIFDAADPGSIRLIALDLLAQAEHGEATLVVAVAADGALLEALETDLVALAGARPTTSAGCCALVRTRDLDHALELANAFAPEHLELIGPGAEGLAGRVRRAGCLFVGWPAGAAFGDYVAGSNHILPTAGSARFASGLSTRQFRRQMTEVRISVESLRALVTAGAPLAEAESFAVHAESMLARVAGMGDNPPL
jgi:histidinol dehydrogenase